VAASKGCAKAAKRGPVYHRIQGFRTIGSSTAYGGQPQQRERRVCLTPERSGNNKVSRSCTPQTRCQVDAILPSLQLHWNMNCIQSCFCLSQSQHTVQIDRLP
jgi:hypothetical protein